MTSFKLSSLAQAVAICAGAVLFAGSAAAADTGRQGRPTTRPRRRPRPPTTPTRRPAIPLSGNAKDICVAEAKAKRTRVEENAEARATRTRRKAREHADPRDRRGRLRGRQGALRRQGRQRQGRLRQGSQGGHDQGSRPTPRPPRRAPTPRMDASAGQARRRLQGRGREVRRHVRAMPRARASPTPRRATASDVDAARAATQARLRRAAGAAPVAAQRPGRVSSPGAARRNRAGPGPRRFRRR